MSKILFKNGEVASSKGLQKADVLVEEGKIVKVGKVGVGEAKGAEVVDCAGKMIMPGAIDVHVHFREPGGTEKEDFESGSKAAIAGGVTTVFDMPNNTPPTTTVRNLKAKRDIIRGKSYVNYGLFIGFDDTNLSEVNKQNGACGVKVYCANSTGKMGVAEDTLAVAFKGVDENKMLVFHSEDEDVIKDNIKEINKSGKKIGPSIHSEVRNEKAAFKMTKKLCEYAKKYDRPIHIAHVSTGAELELIAKYKDFGVTCEVAPHHLVLSTDDYKDMGNFIKMNPPVRSQNDVFALWKGIKAGLVDVIATDHAPHLKEEKEQGYAKVPSGVPGVEMMMPILFNAVNDKALTIEEVCWLVCENPTYLFGIEEKGKIEEGYDADIVIVDMELEKKFEEKDVVSKCGWSPYVGGVYKGWPVKTYVNGVLNFEAGKFLGTPQGRELEFF